MSDISYLNDKSKNGNKISKDQQSNELMNNMVEQVSQNTISHNEKKLKASSVTTFQTTVDTEEVPVHKLLTAPPTTIETHDDFQLRLFDDEVAEYIVNIKNQLHNTFPESEISTTYVIQCLILDRMAAEESRRRFKLPIPNASLLFMTNDNGAMETAPELKHNLVQYYNKLCIYEKNALLERDFPLIVESKSSENTETLNHLIDFYSDIPKSIIKDYILKVLYPEYFETKQKQAALLDLLD